MKKLLSIILLAAILMTSAHVYADEWECVSCKAVARGNFCSNCGTAKPEETKEWNCSCGKINIGNFCSNCGKSKTSVEEAIENNKEADNIVGEYTLRLNVLFIPNLFFSTYDVEVLINGNSQGELKHGEDGNFETTVSAGQNNVSFVSRDSSDVIGECDFYISGDAAISIKISCYSDQISAEQRYLVDLGAVDNGKAVITLPSDAISGYSIDDVVSFFAFSKFRNVAVEPVYDESLGSSRIGKIKSVLVDGQTSFKINEIFDDDVFVEILYHEEVEKDPVRIEAARVTAALESSFPLFTAKQSLVVAMTNCQATDIFTDDGNSRDTAKYHAYSDIGDFFMTIEEDGKWSAVDEITWHVQDAILRIYNYDTYLRVTCDITNEGEQFVLSGVDYAIATKEHIKNQNSLSVYTEHLEPSDSNSFLVVQQHLIAEARDEEAATEKMTAKERRQRWIESQFSWWDGRHEALSDLIKARLNDRASFQHVDTSYIDVSDEERESFVNSVLSSAGINETVVVGDLFITEVFTAKNSYNATVKNTGYGIVRSDGEVILLGIA